MVFYSSSVVAQQGPDGAQYAQSQSSSYGGQGVRPTINWPSAVQCSMLASKAAHDECWLHMQVAEHQMRMKDGRTGHEEMTISRHIGNKVSSYDTSIDIATRHSFYDSDAYTSKVVQERRVLQVCLCLYYVISTHNVQISTWSAGKNCYKAAAS